MGGISKGNTQNSWLERKQQLSVENIKRYATSFWRQQIKIFPGNK
jgi:hypothetical protein